MDDYSQFFSAIDKKSISTLNIISLLVFETKIHRQGKYTIYQH